MMRGFPITSHLQEFQVAHCANCRKCEYGKKLLVWERGRFVYIYETQVLVSSEDYEKNIQGKTVLLPRIDVFMGDTVEVLDKEVYDRWLRFFALLSVGHVGSGTTSDTEI